jgi:AmiR/NasT family two-component response regulator
MPTAPRKLLVVEDEPFIAEDIGLILRKLGFDVVGIVDNGADAVREAQRLNPDLVLMDVQLNGPMDGTEAARQIRATSGRPIIFLTGHSDPNVLKRAKETEPYGYILKPFTHRELMVQIEMALYRHQMETERAQLRHELEIAHENLRTLRGLLPLCAGCKKIREDDGYWSKLEDYFAEHANVEFTHGFCPDCESHLYGTRTPHSTEPLVVERKKNPQPEAAG